MSYFQDRAELQEPETTATVIRNPDGSVHYPSIVPPAVEFPADSPGDTPKQTPLPESATGETPAAAAALPAIEEHTPPPSPALGPRPIVSREWQTERPRPAARSSSLAYLQRKNTNVSALNEAIWNAYTPHDNSPSTSSSSSSSEDEDEYERVEKQRKGWRHRGNSATSKNDHSDRSRQPRKHRYSRFAVGNEDFKTKGRVSKKDGRLNISVNETSNSGYLAKALGGTFLKHLGPKSGDISSAEDQPHPDHPSKPDIPRDSSDDTFKTKKPRPKLNIVVMVIGSRGDIQPFLKIGKVLKEKYGHRVRIATHPAFREFVQKDSGLEFFSVGGDPAELMAFMVKNPGMIPTMETVKKGEIGRRREQMYEMFQGFWRACINATDDEHNAYNLKMMGATDPFIADAIIANPPCFAHIHCAERLGVPLHLMFTFPYTPTQAFPHPLANIKKTNVDPGYTNFISYPLVEMMTWQGLGDLVNLFRVKTLGLEPVSTLWAPGQLYRLKVPSTYLWSPGLVPKPHDWGPEINIAGFVFLDLASSFDPPEDLTKFLETGEPPIYIGFGSIVVDDPDRFTKMIFEAVEKAGVRALVSKGWGGLGGGVVPKNVFMLENTPHDWLFPKVKAVVHHGGAGTTAIGLKCGKPTMIVPFFGDQAFWGSMIGRAGAGPAPVPYKELTMEKLADGIKELLTDEVQISADKIAKSIQEEGDGAENAVRSFHRSLVLQGEHSMRCCILEDRVAVWVLKHTGIRLSALAADILVDKKKISWKQLVLIRHNEWNDFEGPGEPLTGGASAIVGNVTSAATGVASIPYRIAKHSKRRQRHEEKKRRKMKKQKLKHSGNGSQTIRHGTAKTAKKDFVPNGVSECNTNENTDEKTDGLTNGYVKKTSEPKIPALGGENDTKANDMTKKTPEGAPLSATTGVSQDGTENGVTNAEDGNATDGDSVLSADPEENAVEEIAHDVGHGLGKASEAVVKAPMDLTLAIAQGFHNAPRLYGDQTVRHPTRITGMKSGLKAAGEEFVYGVYDGFTGVVTQPYVGARDGGPVGFVKGVGMGLTGFVLKDLAAIFGPFAYTYKGVHKEMHKKDQPTHCIRKARIIQGQHDLKSLSPGLKETAQRAVTHGWSVIQAVMAEMDLMRKQGVKGKFKVMRERYKWRAIGAFENVEMAEKALDAKRQGRDLEDVFATNGA